MHLSANQDTCGREASLVTEPFQRSGLFLSLYVRLPKGPTGCAAAHSATLGVATMQKDW